MLLLCYYCNQTSLLWNSLVSLLILGTAVVLKYIMWCNAPVKLISWIFYVASARSFSCTPSWCHTVLTVVLFNPLTFHFLFTTTAIFMFPKLDYQLHYPQAVISFCCCWVHCWLQKPILCRSKTPPSEGWQNVTMWFRCALKVWLYVERALIGLSESCRPAGFCCVFTRWKGRIRGEES